MTSLCTMEILYFSFSSSLSVSPPLPSPTLFLFIFLATVDLSSLTSSLTRLHLCQKLSPFQSLHMAYSSVREVLSPLCPAICFLGVSLNVTSKCIPYVKWENPFIFYYGFLKPSSLSFLGIT